MEEGATPYEVDQVMEQFGFPMGPFKVSDLSGEETVYIQANCCFILIQKSVYIIFTFIHSLIPRHGCGLQDRAGAAGVKGS